MKTTKLYLFWLATLFFRTNCATPKPIEIDISKPFEIILKQALVGTELTRCEINQEIESCSKGLCSNIQTNTKIPLAQLKHALECSRYPGTEDMLTVINGLVQDDRFNFDVLFEIGDQRLIFALIKTQVPHTIYESYAFDSIDIWCGEMSLIKPTLIARNPGIHLFENMPFVVVASKLSQSKVAVELFLAGVRIPYEAAFFYDGEPGTWDREAIDLSIRQADMFDSQIKSVFFKIADDVDRKFHTFELTPPFVTLEASTIEHYLDKLDEELVAKKKGLLSRAIITGHEGIGEIIKDNTRSGLSLDLEMRDRNAKPKYQIVYDLCRYFEEDTMHELDELPVGPVQEPHKFIKQTPELDVYVDGRERFEPIHAIELALYKTTQNTFEVRLCPKEVSLQLFKDPIFLKENSGNKRIAKVVGNNKDYTKCQMWFASPGSWVISLEFCYDLEQRELNELGDLRQVVQQKEIGPNEVLTYLFSKTDLWSRLFIVKIGIAGEPNFEPIGRKMIFQKYRSAILCQGDCISLINTPHIEQFRREFLEVGSLEEMLYKLTLVKLNIVNRG